MRSYPIWNDVTACNYGSSKSFGSLETATITQKVGSSRSNSHDHVEFVTTKRERDEYKGFENVIVFRTSLDGVCLKESIFENKKGKAAKLLKVNTKLNRIKSL